MRNQYGTGNSPYKGEGREEDLREDGWTQSEGLIAKRGDYRRIKCSTALHAGVCHRTSTPHKSGNKMNEMKTGCIRH